MAKIVTIKKIGENKKIPAPYMSIGQERKGVFVGEPKVGESFEIWALSNKPHERGMYTSLVQEILDENTFKTVNSIYFWTIEEKQ